MIQYYFSFALCLLMISPLSAQKVLQIEKYGSPRTEKFYVGQEITFQLEGTDYYRSAYIEDIRVGDSLILLGNSFVNVHDISALRFERGWPMLGSGSLYTFGLAWSGYAFFGTTFDDNPNSAYRRSDAVVTLTAISLGFLIHKLFRYKHTRLGKRKRLRLLDLSFSKPDWED